MELPWIRGFHIIGSMNMISIRFQITMKRESFMQLHDKGAPPQSRVGKKTPKRSKKETSIKTALNLQDHCELKCNRFTFLVFTSNNIYLFSPECLSHCFTKAQVFSLAINDHDQYS